MRSDVKATCFFSSEISVSKAEESCEVQSILARSSEWNQHEHGKYVRRKAMNDDCDDIRQWTVAEGKAFIYRDH